VLNNEEFRGKYGVKMNAIADKMKGKVKSFFKDLLNRKKKKKKYKS